MLNVIHGADFHLDAPFHALPPEQAAQRREEQRELLFRLARLAEEERADLVLLSGDLFDGRQVYSETLEALEKALGSMKAQVFIAPGNHDLWSARSPYAGLVWPDNVHIFTEPQIETVELPELGCVVHGAAFTAPHREDRALAGFQVPNDGKIHLLVLHADGTPNSQYGPITEEDLAASGLDYAALGHIHGRIGPQRAGRTVWAWPGCPEGRGFDELGDKGVLCGTVGKGEARMRFVPLCGRRYLIREVDVTGQDPEAALTAALPEDESPDLCRIVLTGERGAEPLALEKLEALARPHYYNVSLRDRTHIRRDLWDRMEEDTLTGLFLRGMRRRMEEAPDEEARLAVERAVRFGLSALESREDPQ
ncbi:DNA repair exonuclease [Pseudoflavonifractor sp. MSJ-37]|uniref:metallophosphoesterase family protein n=1 Tax=Pseudoflavonifractor sp. MSJ-37 TaxID=2841531 RepID=UPI001C10F41F|nr:DNA repair exonuclease [Pseudoflavonifractor sp. MSJ-37]MBU5435902.1 DNA repair exonuclease [Pseudoflavonifractor sp. MSJ-37]